MLKIAIVGCGKIADQHVQAIHRVPDCEIVAVCDRELLMAQQLAERFGINNSFADLEKMLQLIRPNVVHITTPPQSHFSLASKCLELGSHVYLEKPFTLTAQEAERLIQSAESRDLRITVGHNYQFTLEMLEMRRLLKDGFLGGKPVHLESYFSYDLGDTSYVSAVLANRNHWVRQLPGKLLHNVLSHGIAKLTEFLDDEVTEIIATADQSAQLGKMGEEEILDELRVMIRDKAGTTAFFCFSTQIKPPLNQLRICGPRNSIVVNQVSGTLIKYENHSDKSYLTYFMPPLRSARAHLKNAFTNAFNFLRWRLHQDFGMKELVERFYTSIVTGKEPPIPYREITLTARIMDEIFRQIYRSDANLLPSVDPASRLPQPATIH